jgi:predicted  nucleic acid-binding Zn-ribbon protein
MSSHSASVRKETQRLEDRLDQSEKDHAEAMSEIRDKVASMRGAKELADEMNKSLVSVFTEVLKAVDSNRK